MGSVDLQKEGWQLDLFCILIVMKNLLTLIYFFYLIYIFCVYPWDFYPFWGIMEIFLMFFNLMNESPMLYSKP